MLTIAQCTLLLHYNVIVLYCVYCKIVPYIYTCTSEQNIVKNNIKIPFSKQDKQQVTYSLILRPKRQILNQHTTERAWVQD